MKIEKGMAVNVEGMNDIVRQAVIKKFDGLGFSIDKHFMLNGNIYYIGRISGTLLSAHSVFSDSLILITLPELMFCDQPEDVMHCFYDDGELYYFNSGEGLDEDYLICTREPAESKSWHEKGGLPPAGEDCMVFHDGEWHQTRIVGFDIDGLCVYDCATFDEHDNYCASKSPDKFKPLIKEFKTDFDSLVEIIEGASIFNNISIDALANAIIDAGWRPSND